MRHFTDDRGQLWCIRIDCATLDRVQRDTTLYLPSLLDRDLAPLAELLEDPLRLARVLYAACHRQAAERGTSFEDFAAGLHGDHLAAAQTAFQEALADFFPEKDRRELLRTVFQRAAELAAAERERAIAALTSLPLHAMQSSSPPPSPNSTPAPTPSPNSSS